MLGLGTGLIYPDAASLGEVIDVSAAGASMILGDSPDDEAVLIGVFFGSDQANAYTAMGLTSPTPDPSDLGNRINGTFDFTVTRYTFGGGSFSATTDTATVTGKIGYAVSLVADNAIIYIASTDTGSSHSGFNTWEQDDGGTNQGINLFDFSSLGGDITDGSVLNNIYVVQATYNPPSGFTGTVTATASAPTLIAVGPS